MKSLCTATRSSFHSSQMETACIKQSWPSTAKKLKKKIIMRYLDSEHGLHFTFKWFCGWFYHFKESCVILKHFPALEVDWFCLFLLTAITWIIHFYRCLLDLTIMCKNSSFLLFLLFNIIFSYKPLPSFSACPPSPASFLIPCDLDCSARVSSKCISWSFLEMQSLRPIQLTFLALCLNRTS